MDLALFVISRKSETFYPTLKINFTPENYIFVKLCVFIFAPCSKTVIYYDHVAA